MKSSGVVEGLLAGRIGLDPTSVGEGLIARGVLARMSSLGVRDRDGYERLLAESPDELQALVEEVVVPESWFFRDARPFEVLRDHARAGWLLDPDRPPLTALSLPCAGGEEPYSIAMTLLEAGLPAGRFRVDAVDVSTRSLARAIAGVYGSNSFRGVDPAIRARYFREQGGASTLDVAARATVRFHLGNLLAPDLLDDRPPFDVVFCRNVLIYLDAPSRGRAFANLGRLLADGGLLFLGHADRPDDAAKSPFAMVPERGGFAHRKGPAAAPVAPRAPVTGLGGRVPPPKHRSPDRGVLPPPSPPGRGAVGGGSSHRQGGPPDLPATGIVAAPHPGPLPGGEGGAGEVGTIVPQPLDAASKLADEGRYDEATALVDRAIARGGAGASAYFLLGMIRQAAGDRDRAEAFFLKAVYLDARHDEALLALALLARRRGDMSGEAAYRRRADRVRSRKGASS